MALVPEALRLEQVLAAVWLLAVLPAKAPVLISLWKAKAPLLMLLVLVREREALLALVALKRLAPVKAPVSI